jgi:hypothetical protein
MNSFYLFLFLSLYLFVYVFSFVILFLDLVRIDIFKCVTSFGTLAVLQTCICNFAFSKVKKSPRALKTQSR